jgi:phage shock protein C
MSDRKGERRPSDFQAAVERLEKAVQELASSAKSEFTDRAASLIDETSTRLERELGGRTNLYGEHSDGRSRRSRRSRRRDRTRSQPARSPSRQLYRDTANQRICGVCSGLANYFGVEPWVVRCGAITGLLFLPGIVFPAYWVLYFVMDEPPRDGEPARGDRKRSDEDRYTSPAPELGPRLSPRGSLRNVQADLAEAELKLRRMETHVTSGQYELQRELNKLESEGGRNARA